MILLVVIVVRDYCSPQRFLSFFTAITLEFLVNINKIKEKALVTDTQKALLFNYEPNIDHYTLQS